MNDRSYSDTEKMVRFVERPSYKGDEEHCPECGTDLLNAPGIGPFCPNKDCDVVDGIKGHYEEVHIHLKDKPDVMYADVGEELAKLNTLFEFYLSQAYGYKEKQDGGR